MKSCKNTLFFFDIYLWNLLRNTHRRCESRKYCTWHAQSNYNWHKIINIYLLQSDRFVKSIWHICAVSLSILCFVWTQTSKWIATGWKIGSFNKTLKTDRNGMQQNTKESETLAIVTFYNLQNMHLQSFEGLFVKFILFSRLSLSHG